MKFYRGKKELYDQEKHGDGMFFTTDSQEIITNQAIYGGSSSSEDSGNQVVSGSFSDGTLIINKTVGDPITITIADATDNTKGLLSSTDKQKIDSMMTWEVIE